MNSTIETGRQTLLGQASQISNGDIRNFTLAALREANSQFWEVPASSTGKYHPPEDQGPGGLVRHVIKGLVVTAEFGRRVNFSNIEADMARSAFCLHDTCKNGLPWKENTDYTHGLIAAKWLEQFPLPDQIAKQTIIDAVRYHMAPWCYAVNPFEDRLYTKEEMRLNITELAQALTCPSRIELAIRDADYWASRKDMSFYPNTPVVLPAHDFP